MVGQKTSLVPGQEEHESHAEKLVVGAHVAVMGCAAGDGYPGFRIQPPPR